MIVFNQLSRDYALGSQTVRALRDVSGEVFAGEWWHCAGRLAQARAPYLTCLACWILNTKVR